MGHTALYDALRSVLRSWVRTTATIVFVGEFGRITALGMVPIRTGLGTVAVLVGSVIIQQKYDWEDFFTCGNGIA